METLTPSNQWLSELVLMEQDPNFMNQFFDQNVESVLDGNFCSLNSDSYSFIINSKNDINSSFDGKTGIDQSMKNIKTESSNSSTTTENLSTTTTTTTPEASSGSRPSSSKIISFGCSNNSSLDLYEGINDSLIDGIIKSKDDYLLPRDMKQKNYVKKAGKGTKRPNPETYTNSPSYDHIMAERRRREKLSQRFIALAALVPSLRKLDKVSVLDDAIKYLKQLEEKVKILEEQTTKKTVESVVFMNKRSRVTADDDKTSSSFVNALPEVEAKVSDKNVLIRIHCEKHEGILVKILAEVEKFHLTVVNSNVMVFGDSALDITIHAKLEVELCMEIKGLVRNLRSEFLRFMQD